MLGLLIKDLQLIKKQGSIFFLMIIFGVIMLKNSDSYVSVYVTYCIVFGGLLVLNTISYDSFDNGYAYIFTLPVTPRLYVAEKYLLAILGSGVGCVFAIGMIAVLQGNAGLWERLGFSLGAWLGILLVISIMLPLNLKYGTEKSRILTVVWVVAVAALMALVSEFGDVVPLQDAGTQLFQTLEKLGGIGLLLVGGGLTAVVFLLSMAVSTRIMQKKEF